MDYHRSFLQAFLNSLTSILILVFLTGCGGGGGGGSETEPETYIGQAVLGPIVNGAVRLYKYENPGVVLWEGVTSDSDVLNNAGLIEFPKSLISAIENDSFYVIEVNGGEDIDTDDDGVIDAAPTPVLGAIHMIAPGKYFKAPGKPGDPGFIISCLSEMVFQMACYDGIGTAAEGEMKSRIESLVPELLKVDITGDGGIDVADVAVWDPVANKGSLQLSDAILNGIIGKIHAGTVIVATVTATAGEHGSIYPSAVAPYLCGTDAAYFFRTEEKDFVVKQILIDGAPVEVNGSDSYTFKNISGSHTIHVTFSSALLGKLNLGHFGSSSGICVSGNYAYVSAGQNGLQIIDISSPEDSFIIGSILTPGSVGGIFASDGYCYAADQDAGLQIIDVENPEKPVIVASLDTPGVAYKVFVSAGYAYVVDFNNGLQIVDVQNPEAPFTVRSVSMPGIVGVYVADNYAYVVNGTGLRIIDIGNPENPVILGRVNKAGASEVFVSDGYAYMINSTGLQIVDIRDKTNPVIVSDIEIPDLKTGLFVSDGYAYTNRHAGLQIIDISDPFAPVITRTSATTGIPNGISVKDGYAFISTGSGMDAINLKGNSGPVIIGRLSLPAYPTPAWGSFDMHANRYYVGEMETGKLSAIDISDPLNPFISGNVDLGVPFFTALRVEGNYAYVIMGEEGLQIVDISDPARPVLAGAINTLKWPTSVYVSGHFAYISCGDPSGIKIIDIHDPANPVIVGSIDIPGSVDSFFISGNYAYVGAGLAGFQIIDIHDPAHPVKIGSLNTPDAAVARVANVSGGYAYCIPYWESGFQVVDVRNPENPVIVRRVDTPDRAMGFLIKEHYLYVLSGSYVIIMDISDAARPITVGTVITGDSFDIKTLGNFAYVETSESILVLDVSNPAGPTILKHVHDEGTAEGAYVAGDYIYVADGPGGIKILDITDPAKPLLMGGTGTPGTAKDVVVADTYAYVADLDNGLQIVDVSDATNPRCLTSIASPDDAAYRVQVSDGYVYVAAGHSVIRNSKKSCGGGVFQVIDVRNPETPVMTGRVPLDGSGCTGFRSICVSGGYAYVMAYNGLYIIDIANPANPVVVSHLSFAGNQIAFALNGDYAYYVTNTISWPFNPPNTHLIYTIDIKDPAKPMILRSDFLDSGGSQDIYISGKYVYLAGIPIEVFDISDPAHPVSVGSIPLSTSIKGILYISNGIAYVHKPGRWNGDTEIDSEIAIIDMGGWWEATGTP
jgi:hypothetical protein